MIKQKGKNIHLYSLPFSFSLSSSSSVMRGKPFDAVGLPGSLTTTGGNDVRAIQVDSKGNVWVGGAAVTSSNSINLGGVPYTNNGGTADAYVALFDLALDPLWEPIV